MRDLDRASALQVRRRRLQEQNRLLNSIDKHDVERIYQQDPIQICSKRTGTYILKRAGGSIDYLGDSVAELLGVGGVVAADGDDFRADLQEPVESAGCHFS